MIKQLLTTTIKENVATALREDVGSGDLTGDLIPLYKFATATIITREDAVLCGTQWVDEVFYQLDPAVTIKWHHLDGDRLTSNSTIATISGSARSILTGERTALNFLQTLSGTATTTAKYAAKLAPYPNCRLLDTRKTIPGLRLAQKYAVTCGGGHNHRIGLYDAILIKENHIAGAGSISNAVAAARAIAANVLLEVEVENLQELAEALACKVTRIMLDNFTLSQMREAVQITAGRAELEASGNITLETLAEVAATGVDFISTGAITKNITATDLSLRLIKTIKH